MLKIHAAPVNKGGEIDYDAIVKVWLPAHLHYRGLTGAQLSDGFNGAGLRNVVTEPGMFAIRDDR
jgi:26S proteasome regulatory subunit T4